MSSIIDENKRIGPKRPIGLIKFTASKEDFKKKVCNEFGTWKIIINGEPSPESGCILISDSPGGQWYLIPQSRLFLLPLCYIDNVAVYPGTRLVLKNGREGSSIYTVVDYYGDRHVLTDQGKYALSYFQVLTTDNNPKPSDKESKWSVIDPMISPVFKTKEEAITLLESCPGRLLVEVVDVP